MRVKELAVLIALCCGTEVNAQSCAELYGAVRREAMYCDFFCDQKKLAPLQEAYETNCIVIRVPLAFLASFENSSGEPEGYNSWDGDLSHSKTLVHQYE